MPGVNVCPPGESASQPPLLMIDQLPQLPGRSCVASSHSSSMCATHIKDVVSCC